MYSTCSIGILHADIAVICSLEKGPFFTYIMCVSQIYLYKDSGLHALPPPLLACTVAGSIQTGKRRRHTGMAEPNHLHYTVATFYRFVLSVSSLLFGEEYVCGEKKKKKNFPFFPWSSKVFFLSERGRGGRAEAAGKMILAER
jgi:hypothetical protein